MGNREKLLDEMISALNHIGLNWFDIMVDYLDFNEKRNKKSTEEMAEIKSIMMGMKKQGKVMRSLYL